jgi:hypothetical protein
MDGEIQRFQRSKGDYGDPELVDQIEPFIETDERKESKHGESDDEDGGRDRSTVRRISFWHRAWDVFLFWKRAANRHARGETARTP